MSDSDMDIDFDSEEEINDLRKMRQIMELDKSSSSSSRSVSPDNSHCQVSGLLEAAARTSQHYVDVSLILNGHMDEKFQHLEKAIERTLKEARDRLKKVCGMNDSDQHREESFRYINCGRPYFKDRESFPAPDNEDSFFMAKSDMYDFSNITSVPGWTVRDKTQLTHQLEKMTKNLKKREVHSKIAELKRESKNKSFSERISIGKKINKMKKELTKINNQKLDDIALPINEEYDWEEVTHSLDRRHSALEYQALWKLYLHPSINKTNWSRTEHQLLQRVAHDHDLHDWDRIAEVMGNNRTGYQCFVYFRTNMNNTFTGKRWSEEEVVYLLRLIDYYKEDNYIPWVKVAALMENRTKIQIYNKFTRMLEQRKGRFLPEEDAVVLTCADDFGSDYKKMAQFLPGRSVSQIRVRHKALTKKRVSTVWTVEEDRKLLQLLSNQDSSANYASVTKYFPGKDRIHIRTRYVTLVKWMRRNPNADIARAPRRGARRLGHGKASENLNVAVESLKSRIQTEANKRKSSRINPDSTEDSIEDGIIATLINENMCKSSFQNDASEGDQLSILENPDPEIVHDAVNDGNLHKMLLILRARLNKELFEKHYMGPSMSSVKVHTSDDQTCVVNVKDQTCVVNVKSYSKQNKITSIELNALPDVWGNHTFRSPEYVLPPHYSTITGCKKLMTFVATKQRLENNQIDILNFSLMGRRNVLLREQLDILLERFNTLFLWPLLLSSESPNLESISDSEQCDSMNREVPSMDRDSDISEAEVYETGRTNVTIDIDSEPEDDDAGKKNEDGKEDNTAQ